MRNAMTDFQKLADEIVGCGVGRKVKHIGNRNWRYSFIIDCPDHEIQDTAEDFCNDWRVAGAMMEKIPDGFGYTKSVNDWIVYDTNFRGDELVLAKNESLPLAINEACCEALK